MSDDQITERLKVLGEIEIIQATLLGKEDNSLSNLKEPGTL